MGREVAYTELKGKSLLDMVHMELVPSSHLGLGVGSDPSENVKSSHLYHYLLIEHIHTLRIE